MFKCPECGGRAMSIRDKKRYKNAGAVRRRRRCEDCGSRFHTLEEVVLNNAVQEASGRAFVLSARRVLGSWQALADCFCCEAMRKAWAADLVRFGDDWGAVCQRKPEVHIFDFEWEEGWPEPVRLPGKPVRFCAWCGAPVVIRRDN